MERICHPRGTLGRCPRCSAQNGHTDAPLQEESTHVDGEGSAGSKLGATAGAWAPCEPGVGSRGSRPFRARSRRTRGAGTRRGAQGGGLIWGGQDAVRPPNKVPGQERWWHRVPAARCAPAALGRPAGLQGGHASDTCSGRAEVWGQVPAGLQVGGHRTHCREGIWALRWVSQVRGEGTKPRPSH